MARASITRHSAQESSGEGGYPILEWAIVVLLIGVACSASAARVAGIERFVVHATGNRGAFERRSFCALEFRAGTDPGRADEFAKRVVDVRTAASRPGQLQVKVARTERNRDTQHTFHGTG